MHSCAVVPFVTDLQARSLACDNERGLNIDRIGTPRLFADQSSRDADLNLLQFDLISRTNTSSCENDPCRMVRRWVYHVMVWSFVGFFCNFRTGTAPRLHTRERSIK